MKHDKPQNLFEALENLNKAGTELVKTVKGAFWHDVARIKTFFKRTFRK